MAACDQQDAETAGLVLKGFQSLPTMSFTD